MLFLDFVVTNKMGATKLVFTRFDINEAPSTGRFQVEGSLCPVLAVSLTAGTDVYGLSDDFERDYDLDPPCSGRRFG